MALLWPFYYRLRYAAGCKNWPNERRLVMLGGSTQSFEFELTRYQTARWDLTLTNDDGSSIVGTLSNPRCEWRAKTNDTSQIIAVFGTSTACPVTGVISITGAVITIVLDDSMSKLLLAGKYYFDIWVDLDGEPVPLGPGEVTVNQNITVPV